MKTSSAELVNVPEFQFAESASSWLSRVAALQGETLNALLEYLGLMSMDDIDLIFVRHYCRRVAAVCGVSHRVFDLHRRMFSGVLQLDRSGSKYLLSDQGRARYRYCAGCLEEQRVKHLPVHWRFKAWRWCPTHMCMLDDTCPHCKSPVYLPGCMASAGLNGAGIGTLGRCFSCGNRLYANHAIRTRTLDWVLVAPWERTLMLNGRALLAALYSRKVSIAGSDEVFSIAAVRRLERQGILPHDHFKLAASELARRHSVLKASAAAKRT